MAPLTDTEIQAAIRTLTGEGDPYDRMESLEVLGRTDDPRVRDALLVALERSASDQPGGETLAAAIVDLLVGLGERRAVPLFLGLLEQDGVNLNGPDASRRAVDALIAFGATEAIPTLEQLLRDETRSEGKEEELLEAIARLGGEAKVGYLIDALESDRDWLAEGAARALEWVRPSEEVLSALRRAVNRADGHLHLAARLALVALDGCPDPTAELRSLLDPREAMLVLDALRRWRRPDYTAPLLDLVVEPAWTGWLELRGLRLLIEQNIAGTAALLERIAGDEGRHLWDRGTAAALSLSAFGFDARWADYLLDLVEVDARRTTTDDADRTTFDWRVRSAEIIAHALATSLAEDPPRHRRWLALLDRLRQGGYTRLHVIARDRFEDLAGSR